MLQGNPSVHYEQIYMGDLVNRSESITGGLLSRGCSKSSVETMSLQAVWRHDCTGRTFHGGTDNEETSGDGADGNENDKRRSFNTLAGNSTHR
jgi:hypothetical protein